MVKEEIEGGGRGRGHGRGLASRVVLSDSDEDSDEETWDKKKPLSLRFPYTGTPGPTCTMSTLAECCLFFLFASKIVFLTHHVLGHGMMPLCLR